MKTNRVYQAIYGTLMDNEKSSLTFTREVLVYLTYLRKHFIDIETGEKYPVIDQNEMCPCSGLDKNSITKVDNLDSNHEITKRYVKTKKMKKSWYIK